MKHKNNSFRLYASVVSLFIYLLIVTFFVCSQAIIAQEMGKDDSVSLPGLEFTGSDPDSKASDDLCSMNAVRRHVRNHINYPESAVEAGHAGTVVLYARINNQGGVNEVLELQPVSDYVNVDEIVISKHAPAGKEIIKSSRHEILISEGHRVIMSLPRLDIPEVYGQTLKFTFKFGLR